jgi:hypothetical protein
MPKGSPPRAGLLFGWAATKRSKNVGFEEFSLSAALKNLRICSKRVGSAFVVCGLVVFFWSL